MGRDEQLSYAMSLTDQLLAVWTKLGGKHAEWTEHSIHEALYKRGRTLTLHTAFTEYNQVELSRSIGMMKRRLAEYQKKWNTQWKAEADARQQRLLDDELTQDECYTYDQVMEYMDANARTAHPAQLFAYERTIGRTAYYRKRDKPLALYGEREADTIAREMAGGRRIDELFEVVHETGLGPAMYRALFTFASRGE
ncbi:MAG: hypothetical protein HY962_07020 [Ignavibacteriae bacterium]|nr:hypothetical protein [Ignavibacteriota bacterium]